MSRFRQKTVIIEAAQYRPGLEEAWVRFSGDGAHTAFATEEEAKKPPVILANVHPAVKVTEADGSWSWVEVREGDWIASINGTTAVLSDQEFHTSFERHGGHNGCLSSAVAALRFLAEEPRPLGGQQSFNSEHLHEIADQLTQHMRLKE